MTAEASTSHIKRFKPYFTPSEVERLSTKQRGKLSVSREERGRQQACGFIDAVGVRLGFPRRTVATAQTLHMRFHLFFPHKDFNYMEVALSSLYVSSKLHDTLKKPREIILASYALRFPQLVKKGAVDPASVDPNMLESERKRVLSIERLVLETMCFKFRVDTAFGVVIKLAKALGLSKELTQRSWRVAVDCYRTPAPLSYPPHVLALGSLYTAALLSLETAQLDESPRSASGASSSGWDDIARRLGSKGAWEDEYAARVDEVDEVAHALIDLYNIILSTPYSDPSATAFTPSPTSPRDAPSPASQPNSGPGINTAFRLAAFWTPQTLTMLKIHLRERRPGKATAMLGWPDTSPAEDEDREAVEGMGRNDMTVRFVWDNQVPL